MKTCKNKNQCMMVNLDILQPKNVIINIIRPRDNFFVQYYLFSDNGEENNITMSSKEMMVV